MVTEVLCDSPESIGPLRGRERASYAAKLAVIGFSERTHSDRAYEHPARVADILADFTHDELGQWVYDAVFLHDIAQTATDTNHPYYKVARQTIRSYRNKIVAEESPRFGQEGEMQGWVYVSTLLSELDAIEGVSERYRLFSSYDSDLAAVLQSKKDIAIPHTFWRVPAGLTKPEEMYNLLGNVNLESVLIKSAEMLDNLNYPAPKDRSILQDIFEAESFYAPLEELLGHKGFSMALRSRAAILRLEKSNQADYISQAQNILETIGDRDAIKEIISNVFARVLPGESIEFHSINDTSEHRMVYGESLLHLPEIPCGDITAKWRAKSLGSLALKLEKFDGELPADVIGINLVTDDLDSASTVFGRLIRAIKMNGNVREKPAPSRIESYSIQGGSDYIEQMKTGVLLEGVGQEELDCVPKSNGHQVSKATFEYTLVSGVPVNIEIMVQTRSDYLVSERGEAAHINYKADSPVEQAHLLQAIHARKKLIGTQRLNGQSLQRGEDFRTLIEEARGFSYI